MEINKREIDVLIKSLEANLETIDISDGAKRFEYGTLLQKLILIKEVMDSSSKLVLEKLKEEEQFISSIWL